MDVVQRQGRDHGVCGRQRVQEATFLKRDPIRETGQPSASLAEHVRVNVENGNPDTGKPIEHSRRERTGAATEVEDMPVDRRECREQLDTGCDHLVVVWDQAPDLVVVAIGVDVEMTLDRVRLTTGHWASLHRPSVSSARAPSRLDRAMARPPGGSLAEVVAVGCQDAGGKNQDPHGGGDDADNDDPGPVLRGRLGGTGGYHDPQNESDQRHRDARDVAEDDESTGAVAPDVGCGAVVRCVVDGPVFAVWSGWCCSAHPRYLSSDRRADAERLATRDTAALTATTVNGVAVGSGVLADIELAERPDSSGPDVASRS